ncbi:MAG TPA: helix-turn-helix domain-containing protein [Acidimicrobiia bacterium]|jgi:AcrR family transcriptional regulator
MANPNRRARQAEQTKAEILTAARSLFAQGGFAKTSVKEVAAAAGVSVQTVYDSVGSKADLVRELNDHIDAEAGIGAIAMTIPTIDDPRELIAVPARIARALLESSGDILRATMSALPSDPALAPVVQEGRHRHELGTRGLASRLEALGALRVGLSADEAGATMAVLSDPWLAVRLADEYAWPAEKIEAWTTEILERVILGP